MAYTPAVAIGLDAAIDKANHHMKNHEAHKEHPVSEQHAPKQHGLTQEQLAAIGAATISANTPSEDDRPAELPKRTLYTIIAGAVSAVVGYAVAHIYSQDKMREFELAYEKKAQDLILESRNGLGGAIADGSSGFAGGVPLLSNNLAAGSSSHLLENVAYKQLLVENAGGKYTFAKWMDRIGGKGMFTLGAGLAAGLAGAAIAHSIVKDEKPKDWSDRVETDKDQPRTLN